MGLVLFPPLLWRACKDRMCRYVASWAGVPDKDDHYAEEPAIFPQLVPAPHPALVQPCSTDTSFIDALTGVLDPAAPRLPMRSGPTTSVMRHDVNVADERRGVVLLDTPGLPSPEDQNVAPATRTRALRALITMVEDRLSRVLAEESKVVRRKSDGGELVHLSE